MEWLRLLCNGHTKWPNELSIRVIWATLPQNPNFLALMFVLFFCAILYKSGMFVFLNDIMSLIRGVLIHFQLFDLDHITCLQHKSMNQSFCFTIKDVWQLYSVQSTAIHFAPIYSTISMDNWRLRPVCQSVFVGWLLVRFVDYIWYKNSKYLAVSTAKFRNLRIQASRHLYVCTFSPLALNNKASDCLRTIGPYPSSLEYVIGL